MRLLVLSTSVGKRAPYRGTDRTRFAGGRFTTDSDYSVISRIWDEYHEVWDKSHESASEPDASSEESEDIMRLGWSPPGLVRNIDEARWLVDAFRKKANIELEIIEICRGNAKPEIGGEFLGYDLSAGYDESLLSCGLRGDLVEPDSPLVPRLAPYVPGDLYRRSLAASLSLLVDKYFQPRLNANGLFDDYAEAAFCLRCMVAIPFVSPESYEREDSEGESDFEVLGLFKVRDAR